MESKTIREVIKWNELKITKSRDKRDIARYEDNIRKLKEVLEDDSA